MERMAAYCHLWQLKPSTTKTVYNLFHLQNTSAAHELRVHMEEKLLRHDPHPVYLGVTLARTLSYRHHLTKIVGKLQSRNNLLMKLAGPPGVPTLICWRHLLWLCATLWQNEYGTAHVSLIDVQLHSFMRLISGTIRSTPLPWLPFLTNIEPPALRRRAATDKLLTQAECHSEWPLYDDVFHPPLLRLKSCKPLWRIQKQLMSQAVGGTTGSRLQWSIPV